MSPSVLIPKRTLLTTRAQAYPFLFAYAIQSHRPRPTRAKKAPKTSPTLTATLSWLSVRLGLLAATAFRIASFCVRPMINEMRLRAAPAYMSFTAVTTDAGALGRCGGGGKL